ncbi:MAG: hypothetical protein JWM13_2759 [Arthrobacter sp.]|jgi:hypothetical protein|nr:hypothetical protein [Arthrobacter sp.]
MSENNYIVLEADYLDEQEGIERGATVTAEPGESAKILNVVWVGEKLLDEPVPVFASQLQKIAA